VPTATPDVVVQGFGPDAAAYFDRQYTLTLDLMLVTVVLGLLVLFFVAAFVTRELFRARR
jgi:hypothetical protein